MAKEHKYQIPLKSLEILLFARYGKISTWFLDLPRIRDLRNLKGEIQPQKSELSASEICLLTVPWMYTGW